MQNKFKNLQGLIGNTPLVKINFTYKGQPRCIYAKVESYNLSGSIKDRVAYHVLKRAYEEGKLHEDTLICEATSGNMGISFAALGASLGYNVRIYMPDWMSEERKKLLQSFGAEIMLVSKEEGGFLGSIQKCEDIANENPKVFLPRQFSNKYNSEAHYLTTGPEIWERLQKINVTPDGFVAGVGTGGTVMGVGAYLRQQNPKVKVYPLEPKNSPTLATGYKTGNHRIQGISDEFIPDLVKLDTLNEIISVDDGDAVIMAQKFAKDLGLGVGISSGANFIGAIMAQEMQGASSSIVTVFSDDNKKYLSTDLLKEEPVKEGFLSTDVKLISMEAI
ncbi:cysteine synthase A [Hathewaya proteolytica DSM 3090]|uniref:cysteine synthase n=1 Tax=Hathewaya proteolytica DSM 3090 TaxID=1121331 RepID=A0A1M6RG32_9CLOT|nr:PLP-dependent cysteine synthase family protein [Hathewaya proteolytica]SHK31370.1 cysteine synthase A [Hathewaya proteolytica DSM 3090]